MMTTVNSKKNVHYYASDLNLSFKLKIFFALIQLDFLYIYIFLKIDLKLEESINSTRTLINDKVVDNTRFYLFRGADVVGRFNALLFD
jgi:hypothetical protein